MHGVGGFQITVAKSHKIKKSVAKDLTLPEKRLHWVMPPLHYDVFIHELLEGIEQFAVLVPYAELVPPRPPAAPQLSTSSSKQQEIHYP